MNYVNRVAVAVAMAGIFTSAHAEGLRIEAGAGAARYELAPEGSWWYDGFKQDTDLHPGTWHVGLAWFPISRGAWKFGMRGGYADLGIVKATNQFPIYEHGGQADARNNPNCNRDTLEGCTGQFKGRQPTKGLYFGPALERSFGSFSLGGDVGIFVYRSKWIATDVKGVDAQGEFVPDAWVGYMQNEMDKTHTTWYAGANAKWKELFLQARRYGAVHAADTDKGPMYIGMTSGPVWTFTAGVSLEIQ